MCSHQPEQPISLQVSVVLTLRDRLLEVSWQIPADSATFAHTRLFLTPLHTPTDRVFLGVVDAGDHAAAPLPETTTPGSYVVEVETYSSASWGGGRLSGTGRSESFTVE